MMRHCRYSTATRKGESAMAMTESRQLPVGEKQRTSPAMAKKTFSIMG